MLFELLNLIGSCIGKLRTVDPRGWATALFVGAILAALCWWGCSSYSRLWNLRYRVTLGHHALCGLAALLTLLFTLVYASLAYTKDAAYDSLQGWQKEVNQDQKWASRVFADAYHAVQKLGIEDFSNYPPPEQGGQLFPSSDERSIITAATTYAASGAAHFAEHRPFLSRLLRAGTEVPQQIAAADTKAFFASAKKGENYEVRRALTLVAKEIRRNLDEQVPRLVILSRRIAVVAFLLVQLIPFGLVGIAAYRDLKFRT